jgi:hypothetical protein
VPNLSLFHAKNYLPALKITDKEILDFSNNNKEFKVRSFQKKQINKMKWFHGPFSRIFPQMILAAWLYDQDGRVPVFVKETKTNGVSHYLLHDALVRLGYEMVFTWITGWAIDYLLKITPRRVDKKRGTTTIDSPYGGVFTLESGSTWTAMQDKDSFSVTAENKDKGSVSTLVSSASSNDVGDGARTGEENKVE